MLLKGDEGGAKFGGGGVTSNIGDPSTQLKEAMRDISVIFNSIMRMDACAVLQTSGATAC